MMQIPSSRSRPPVIHNRGYSPRLTFLRFYEQTSGLFDKALCCSSGCYQSSQLDTDDDDSFYATNDNNDHKRQENSSENSLLLNAPESRQARTPSSRQRRRDTTTTTSSSGSNKRTRSPASASDATATTVLTDNTRTTDNSLDDELDLRSPPRIRPPSLSYATRAHSTGGMRNPEEEFAAAAAAAAEIQHKPTEIYLPVKWSGNDKITSSQSNFRRVHSDRYRPKLSQRQQTQ